MKSKDNLEYNSGHVRAFIPTIKKARFVRTLEYNPNHVKAYNLILNLEKGKTR